MKQMKHDIVHCPGMDCDVNITLTAISSITHLVVQRWLLDPALDLGQRFLPGDRPGGVSDIDNYALKYYDENVSVSTVVTSEWVLTGEW